MKVWRSADLPPALAGDLHAAFAPHYDAFYEDVYGPLAAAVAEPVLVRVRAMKVGASPCALDVGAGTGRLALPLAADGWRVIAVEKSRAMLARLLDKATTAGLRIEGWLGELRPGAVEPASVDAIVMTFGVVDYVVVDDDLVRLALACREAAKPTARLFVQPTPRGYFADVTSSGRRYSGVVEVGDRGSGRVDLRQVVTLDGVVVVDERIALKVRSEAQVERAFRAGGWQPAGREHDGIYPLLVFEPA
ncbi:MAG: class I SAM-dependent methyltransferase [Vicinamibacteria bacterium]|nr:class I SAM-dependent methyltransferase [Vicinamibacteria bacterium]